MDAMKNLVRPFLRIYEADRQDYMKYGAKARIYLQRMNVSTQLMSDKDFAHDWLTEFKWHDLDATHNLMDGLKGVLKQYDWIKRERRTVGGLTGEALGDKVQRDGD
jgi:hypothetical protein